MASDRVVRVSLVAQVNNYVANMEAARKSTAKVGDSLEAQKAASIAAAKAQGEASEKIGRGFMAIGALAAVGVGLAVKKFADFDQKMSNVQAATNETTENMGLLRAAAIQAGLDTAYSAGEAADAVTELAKAGVATADILGGALTGALSLAAAGEISVARAAEIAATAMTQFKLEGTKVGHVADLLSSGANKAQGGVEDLAQALGQGGLVAAATGLTLEETVGTLSAFASAGLLGGDAGTSFKSMLQRLTPVSKESKDKMDELGISAYDAQGSFIGMEKFAGNLQTSLKDLTPEQRNAAQAIIFGSDAVRASNILYEQGAAGIGKWVSEVDDSGAAARTAAIKLDNLNGDLQILGGSFETALIQSGSGANDVLRALTQGATGLVNVIGSLPAPVLAGGLAVGGLVAVVGLAGGAALIAVPKFAAMKASLSTLGISAGTAAKGVGLLSGGLAVAGIAFALFAARQAEATANTQEFKDSLDPATGAMTSYTRELVAKKLAESGAYGNAMRAAGITQKELTDAVVEGGDALDAVKKKLGAENTFVSFFDGTGIAAGNASSAINDLAGDLDRSETEFDDQAAAADGSAVATGTAAEEYQNAATTAGDLQANLSTLIDTMNKLNGVGQDAVSQNIEYQASLAEVDAQIAAIKAGTEGFAAGLDIATESGRENKSMLVDLASSSQSAAKAQFDLDGNTANYRTTLEKGRQAVIDRARALGATKDEANDLADAIYNIPSEAEFNMIADTQAAQRVIDKFIYTNSGRRVNLIVDGVAGRQVHGSDVTARAEGGAIYGAGTGTSDSIPAWLSNGEHVLTASEVAKMGGQGAVYRFRQGIAAGTTPKFASGGSVGQPVQYVPSGGDWGNSTTNNRTGDTWNISTPSDPVATAQAVSRRQNRLDA